MLRLSRATCTLCCAVLLLVSAGKAHADSWDLQLSRLCQLQTYNANTSTEHILDCGGGYDPTVHGEVLQVLPDNPGFRSVMSELGAVFAPNILSPSDTQGYGGFSFDVQFGWTMVNPKKNSADYISTVQEHSGGNATGKTKEISTRGHRYWRAAGSVNKNAFSQANIRDQQKYAAKINQLEDGLPASFAPTITFSVGAPPFR